MGMENDVVVYLDGAELADVSQEKEADLRGHPEEHGIPKNRSENHEGSAGFPHYAFLPSHSPVLLSAAEIIYHKKPKRGKNAAAKEVRGHVCW